MAGAKPKIIEKLKAWLAHPGTSDFGIDDPRTTQRRRELIQGNRFLWRIYDEWYRLISGRIPAGPGRVVEVGSGAGFLAQVVPGLITSEVFSCPHVHVVFDARRMPLQSGSLKAIALVDVLHHIPDSRPFFREAERCLRPGGSLLMVEPWLSTWSRPIYGHLHHEPLDPNATDWSFPEAGPLSGANIALPWMLFDRDRRRFEAEFPRLVIQEVRPFMPFCYLLSGGVSLRQLMPEAAFRLSRGIESLLSRWPRHWSMFAFIHLRRL